MYICWTPRGRPNRPILFRLEPALVEEVKQFTDNVTGAAEEGLAWWLKRAKRQQAAADIPWPSISRRRLCARLPPGEPGEGKGPHERSRRPHRFPR